MNDLIGSLTALTVAVLVSELSRRAAARLCSRALWIYLLEAASTFQLCSCCHELKLLGETGQVDMTASLTLCFIITVIHLLTLGGALCNPGGALEKACRGTSSVRSALVLIACQFGAAVAAQHFATSVWSLGLSDLHVRHQRFGFRCFDPLGGTVLEAAAVELACAFVFQAALMHVHKLNDKLQVPVLAAVITALIYAGGSISGAVFNPVLAFSVQFPCSGHTYLEYCFIYWLGPLLGMSSSILLFEKIIPFLTGKNSSEVDDPNSTKQKTQ